MLLQQCASWRGGFEFRQITTYAVHTMNETPGQLYLVATPIGNLDDISARAIATLQRVDLIAAEDTRYSKRLLAQFSIGVPCISLHEHNEQQRTQLLLDKLQAGQNIALISDAGTPLISDPGYRLVSAVRKAGIRVEPIPGPCALISGLIASGMPTDHFMFEGFLPAKGSARDKALQALASQTRTIILYESVHRIVDLIERAIAILGEQRQAAVARELTKTFETIYSGSLADILQWLNTDSNQRRGEFVVVIHGAPPLANSDEELLEQQRVLAILMQELSLKQAVDLTVKITGGKKKLIYQLALSMR